MHRFFILPLLLLLLVFTAWASDDGEPEDELRDGVGNAAQEEEIPTIRIFGKVTSGPEKIPVEGATVSLPGRSVVTGPDGSFSFEKVPQERQTDLNLRILDDQGDVIGCSAIPLVVDHVAVAADAPQGFTVEVVGTREDAELELKLVQPAGNAINDYCSVCHRPNPCTTEVEKASSWDSVDHLGGVAVPLSELEEFKMKISAEGVDPGMIRNLRYRDIHPHERDLTPFVTAQEGRELQFRRPDKLPLGDPPVLTCEVCHTRHRETGQQSFLRLEFIEENTLCLQCHL